MKKFKTLTPKAKEGIANEVKLMLAAHRDGMWSRWESCASSKAVDPQTWQIIANDGFYGEAFGIMRALCVLGYGYFGPDSLDAIDDDRSQIREHNLKWWFGQLQHEYLDEEGYFDKSCTAVKCKDLLNKYRILVRK